ncbi:hypothetical protein GDO81_010741 [Engystomops pustulosus]|uniref:Calcium modulating ligand n=1 Tax=Engystomops pustulosus TaxID=76066 RepID=A0AAV7C3Y2_ENGPU|nr:hypothetical protein GDO81_010741 [Engystomops pustulosus]
MATLGNIENLSTDVLMTASQRKAEIRRRKLINNSEERMNRIMGIHKPPGNVEECEMEQCGYPGSLKVQPSLTELGTILVGDNKTSSDQPWGIADGIESYTAPADSGQSSDLKKDGSVLKKKKDVTIESTPQGLNQYITRFDEAMKLRNQLGSEKPAPENGSGVEELDSFSIFRLVGSAILALTVRLFVCKYLGEKKTKTTVLTAALLLSGIPSEVISRSLDTYGKMVEVFTELCVYFFTFIFCHELLLYFGTENQ